MAADEFVDYYELLGVSTDAMSEHVRAAFVRLAKQHHPDVGGSTEHMQRLTTAYRTLVSPPRRRAYDLLHDFHSGETKAHYRDEGDTQGSWAKDLSDEEIDDFLNSVHAEFRAEAAARPKPSLWQRLQSLL